MSDAMRVLAAREDLREYRTLGRQKRRLVREAGRLARQHYPYLAADCWRAVKIIDERLDAIAQRAARP